MIYDFKHKLPKSHEGKLIKNRKQVKDILKGTEK